MMNSRQIKKVALSVALLLTPAMTKPTNGTQEKLIHVDRCFDMAAGVSRLAATTLSISWVAQAVSRDSGLSEQEIGELVDIADGIPTMLKSQRADPLTPKLF